MILSAIEQYAKAIGEECGASNDRVQSDLLNGFCEMLDHSIISASDMDMQIAFFTSKMTPRAKKVLIHIARFCGDE